MFRRRSCRASDPSTEAALADDRQANSRYHESSQILLVTACPLPGSIPNLTAWAMTRVFTFAGSGYRLLMAGLSVLFAAVLAAAALLIQLTMTWSRHVGRIEAALKAHDIAELPTLTTTGERELDRIVMALNDAGRRLAEARRRADQLARQVATRERLAAIGRVAAGVAHEIRNPIAAMQLKAESALIGDAERKNQALVMILGQIGRIDALIRRLLSVSEREKLNRTPVALRPFLQSCLAPHVELARSKAMALESIADDEEATFDPDQMRRALDNLVLNAIEAAPKGTTILVAARRDRDNLVLSVRDQGPGPPAEIRDQLFEPFVTGRADGTGLGLSIVREVAAAHGGTARAWRLSHRNNLRDRDPMATVLIVDDDAAMREALGEAARDLGYDAQSAASGTEAIDFLTAHSVDAVLLDLRMPGMDGLEVLRRIRSRPNPAPVTVLTAHATAANTIEAMRLGAFDHLTKPIGREDVARALRRNACGPGRAS